MRSPVPTRPTTPVVASPVTVPSLRANPKGLLIPAAYWVLLRGGRWLCKGGQYCMRLTPYTIVLPLEDTRDVLTRPVR